MAFGRYAAKAYGAKHAEKPLDPSLATEGKKPRGRKGFVPYNNGTIVPKGSAYVAQPNLSAAQRAIIADVCQVGNGSLLVDAKAGSSKTTVLIESMYRLAQLFPNLTVAYFIFAKRNQVEAESKAPASVNCQTAHSLGLRALKSVLGKIEVDTRGDKAEAIARGLFGGEDEKIEARYNFVQALGLAKAYLCETAEDVAKFVEKHEVDLLEDTAQEFATKILEGLRLSAVQNRIVDFNDMVWLPVRLNLTLPQFDIVMADEAQDLSPARIQLILRTVKPNGKLISVGDDRQSIFSFTGSDAQSLATIRGLSDAHVLPLNMTFRCGRKIVELCQEIVPEYEAHESNPEGLVAEKSEEDMLRDVQPGDAILSRVNAPLVGYALQLLKAGRKANILGRDLGKGMLYMLKRSGASDVNAFLTWLTEWANIECERKLKKNQDTTQIKDKMSCMESFCEGTNDLAEVRKRINDIFSDSEEGNFVILSSVHRFKGLERSTVWVLANTLKRGKNTEEDNIAYVSFSRARNCLFLVK